MLDPSGFVISQAAYDQQYPAIGFDGANYLVVWQDFRRGYAYDIYGARVTPEGTVLDPVGIIISQADERRSSILPSPLTARTSSWRGRTTATVPDSPDIYGARVTPEGTVLDPAGFVISQAAHSQYDPAVAFDGTNFLVVWRTTATAPATHIYGARVTPAGRGA